MRWLILVPWQGAAKVKHYTWHCFLTWYQFWRIKWVEFSSNKMVGYLYLQVADTEDYITD